MSRRSDRHPDFISIGSARCGSTWLAERMRLHPGVWIPPIKEIHYFDMQRVLPPWHWIRLRRYAIHLRRYAAHLVRRNADGGRHRGFELRWGLDYFLGLRGDDWYRRVLTPPEGMISGEVTPAYCMLEDREFERMAEAFPSTKFIFSMRNPIDRDWSQTVMHLGLHRRREDPSTRMEVLREVLSRDQVIRRSSYLEVLARLDRLPPERVHVYFFDRIAEDPFGTLRDICGFLGVDPDERMMDETARRKVATRDMGGRGMPPEIESMLAARWLPMIEQLAERFEGPPRAWLERARTLTGGSPP